MRKNARRGEGEDEVMRSTNGWQEREAEKERERMER